MAIPKDNIAGLFQKDCLSGKGSEGNRRVYVPPARMSDKFSVNVSIIDAGRRRQDL